MSRQKPSSWAALSLEVCSEKALNTMLRSTRALINVQAAKTTKAGPVAQSANHQP